MGITLSAIVEAAQTRDNGSVFWWEVATVEFNKNYILDIMLHEAVDDGENGVFAGWPADSAARRNERYRYCDQGERWCEGEKFVRMVEHAPACDPEDQWWKSKQVQGLIYFLKALQPWKTRVLFYTM